MRAAATWREAHRILLEFDAIGAGTKALVAAVGGSLTQTRTDRRKPSKPANAGNSPAVNAVDTPNVCFRARDQGACDRPGCTFSHDEGLLKAARKEEAEKESSNKKTREAREQARARTRAKARARARMRRKKERRNFASAS